MKILVVSGFLGAGKTTFIKELAKRTHRDFAVMENEYGDVNIDSKLLAGDQDASEKINIWELTEGCICCSMKADFASSVLTIANTVDPEFLIVEPTGVGMLSNVMENIRKIQYERISLLSPVTILDGNCFDRYIREFPEIFRDQLAAAGSILISKMESADAGDIAALKKRVAEINPDAEIYGEHYSSNSDAWWQSLLTRPYDPSQVLVSNEEFPDLENLGLTNVSLKTPDQLILFLQGVVSGVFGDICRSKGYLRAGKAWLRFDTVDRTYTVTGMEEMPESQAVFIGKNLKRSLLREALQRSLRFMKFNKNQLS